MTAKECNGSEELIELKLFKFIYLLIIESTRYDLFTMS